MNLHTYCVHWHSIFKTPPLIFPHYHILLCDVCYIWRFQLFGMIQRCVKFCDVLGLWITIPYCQHCTLLEELYRLNMPWKQVKYNAHNAYQAVSRVLHEFVTCVTRVNWTQLIYHTLYCRFTVKRLILTKTWRYYNVFQETLVKRLIITWI